MKKENALSKQETPKGLSSRKPPCLMFLKQLQWTAEK